MFYFDNFYGEKVLKSDLLPQNITAFFTTREKEYTNCEHIHNILKDKLNIKRVLTPTQTHSDNVSFVDNRNVYKETDGLILNNANDAISLRFADCTPIILYDEKQKIGAISHAGWKGTAKSIVIKTIEKMKSNSNDIIAIIGPAISVCCYEVKDDVKEKLLSTVKNRDDLYKDNYVDLKKINAKQLEEAGVNQIDICTFCTSCNNDLFYSYRKENATDKRHRAILGL